MAYATPHFVRNAILRRCGYHLGQNAVIFSGSIIRSDVLEVGDGTFINHRCLFDRGEIRIGANVYISSGVTLATGDHTPGGPRKRAGADIVRPIVVGDGSWIGANVVILSGVTIAPGCVIGAGSIVNHDTVADSVYVGAPARRVRALPVSGQTPAA